MEALRGNIIIAPPRPRKKKLLSGIQLNINIGKENSTSRFRIYYRLYSFKRSKLCSIDRLVLSWKTIARNAVLSMATNINLRPAARPAIVDHVSLRNINLHLPAAPDPWHRSGKSQPCTAAVKLSYSSAAAAASADDVSLSIDYGKLYRRIETAVQDAGKTSSQALSHDVRILAGIIADCGLGLLDETIAGVRRMAHHVQVQHPESPNRRRASQASRRLSGSASTVVVPNKPATFYNNNNNNSTGPELLNSTFGECEVSLQLPNTHLRAEGGLFFRSVQTWVYADDGSALEDAVENKRQISVVEQEFRIEGIRCHCILGVNSHERIEKQSVIITLVFRGSGDTAWASTVVNKYQEMVKEIAEVKSSSPPPRPALVFNIIP